MSAASVVWPTACGGSCSSLLTSGQFTPSDRSRTRRCEGARATVWGLKLGFGSVATSGTISVARKRVLRLMRRRTISRPIAAAAVDRGGEIITHAPNLMWVTRMASSRIGDDRRLLSASGRRRPSAGMSQARRPLDAAAMGLPGCMARHQNSRRGSGAGLADGCPVSGTTSPTRFTSRHTVRASSRPMERRRRAVQSHAEGTDHPWSHLPQHRGAAGRRPRLCRTLQCLESVDRHMK